MTAPPLPGQSGGALTERERTIAEYAYEAGFWDGVKTLREASVALPEDWVANDVAASLEYIETILERRGL